MTATYTQDTKEASPNFQSNCIDPLDIDQYINYDQAVFPSSSSSTPSVKVETAPVLPSSSSYGPTQSAQQQTFSGPSHQYEQYKQQAGLPVGALANTFALNQPNQFSYTETHPYDIITPVDGYFGMNNTDDFMDFGTAPAQSAEIDMDLSTFSHDMSTLNSSFLDPAVGSKTPRARSTSSQPSRAWPGMHQQQADLAKAQQEAMQQRQQVAIAERAQAKVPSNAPRASHSRQSSRPNTDPVVEESISRLLHQMRHNSVTSSADDDASTPTASGSSYSNRMRKEEEDMDEDERLLASEEGKKLSSKERRQLRNKVSARAFRSRRKEYIGQLEGEIAGKCNEADELRAKNEELMAENTRLTDLTRMLLSSSAFSTFLNDLSNTGMPPPKNAQSQNLAPQQHQPQQNHQQHVAPRKDIDPNQAQNLRQNNMQVGMTMIPESPFEYTAAESTNNGWAEPTNNAFGLYDAQVFAVTAVPEAPAFEPIDFGRIHGKSSNFVGSYDSFDDTKDEPVISEIMPLAVSKDLPTISVSPCADIDFNESDSAFALFSNQESPSKESTVASPEESIFGDIALEKAFERVELVIDAESSSENGTVSAATMERFERLTSRLETSAARISAVTRDL